MSDKDINALLNNVNDALLLYIEKNTSKPRNLRNFFMNKYTWSGIFSIIALWGYWFNWRADIVASKIADVQSIIREKRATFDNLDKAITATRILVINQRIRCDIVHKSVPEQQIERNNSLANIYNQTSLTNGFISREADEALIQFASEIYTMTDVCELNKEKLDDHMHDQYKSISLLLSRDISGDLERLNELRENNAIVKTIAHVAR